MTNNVMNRRFTLRESILMGVLVAVLLVGLFFMLVYYPVKNQRADIQAQLEDIEFKQEVADIRYNMYKQWQAELETIYSLPEDERTVMPKHTAAHEQEILAIVGAILEGTNEYTTNWSITHSDSIYRRTLSFSFSVASFDTAYSVLEELTSIRSQNQKVRSQISNINVSPSSGSVEDDSLRVNGTLTFFEVE